eukprot:TRINITY_DN94096_c0_g1_i1.p1 TRINITY_DN94096_c0_g1~~TRINITY_DN94096_c0_g1_i1.p1  ORF type:complete len:336 (+),score=29.47 TRINITY_DN94096_c0_g1_i1:29-1009(+)
MTAVAARNLTATPDQVSRVGTLTAQRMVSACFGSVLTALFMTPLDVARVRQQFGHARLAGTGTEVKACTSFPFLSLMRWDECCAQYTCRSTARVLMKIAQSEGPLALWSGLKPALIMALPTTTCYLVGYDFLRQLFRHTDVGETTSILVSGGGARAVAVFVASPLELVRTQLQAGTAHSFTHAWQKQRSLAKNLWRGVGATLYRDVPFSMLYWYNFEGVRKKILQTQSLPETNAPLWVNFVSGATSGTVAALLTHPFDIAKTQIQARLLAHSGPSLKTFHVIENLVRDHGWRGLTVGLAPRLLKIAPSCAIMISAYEAGKAFFGAR